MDLLDNITRCMDNGRPGYGTPVVKKPKYDDHRPGTSSTSNTPQSGSFKIPKRSRMDDQSTPTSAMRSVSVQESYGSRGAPAPPPPPSSGGYSDRGYGGGSSAYSGADSRGPPGYNTGDKSQGPPGYSTNRSSYGGSDRNNDSGYGTPGGDRYGAERVDSRASAYGGDRSSGYGGPGGNGGASDRGSSNSYSTPAGVNDRSNQGGYRGDGGNDRGSYGAPGGGSNTSISGSYGGDRSNDRGGSGSYGAPGGYDRSNPSSYGGERGNERGSSGSYGGGSDRGNSGGYGAPGGGSDRSSYGGDRGNDRGGSGTYVGGSDRGNSGGYGAPGGGSSRSSYGGNNRGDQSNDHSSGYGSNDRSSSGGYGRDQGNDRGSSSGYGGDRGGNDRSSYGGNDRRGDYGNRGGGYGGGDRGGRGGYDRGGNTGGRFDGGDRGNRNGGDRGGYGNAEVKQEFKPNVGNNNNYGGNRSFGGGRPTGRDHLEVEMNALRISSNEVDSVKRFHVDIIKSLRGKERDMARGMKHDQAYIAKEMCVFGIMDVMYRMFPQLFGKDKYSHAYDGGYSLYSIGCTIDELEDGSMSHVFSKEEVANMFPEAVRAYIMKCDSLKVSLKYTGNVYIRGPKFNNPDNQREAIKFFEVVTDCYLHEGNFLNYTTKSFDKRGFNKDIGGAKLVKKGLDKNVRLVGDSVESGQLILQASSKASAFHKNETVLEYLSEVLNCRPSDVPKYLSREKRDCDKATNELKNVFVACTHIKRSFCLRRIDFRQTAANTFFENKEGVKLSVEEYYRANYNVHLKYPDCPVAIETKPGGSSYFPLELLEVMEGQRVGTAALGNNAEKVHQVARALPPEQKTNTLKQLEAARLRHGSNPYLQAFGISLDSEFIKYDAKILAPPVRIGGNNETCVAASRSKLRKFFDAARTDKKIVICALDRCMRDDDCYNFYKRFSQAASSKGMQIPSSPVVLQLNSESEERIRNSFAEWSRAGDVTLAIFITKEKLDNVHHPLKLMETEFAICTEHLWAMTVRKCSEDRGGAATVDNVLRKFNVKLGGLNENIAPSASKIPPGMDPKVFAECLNNRLFIGVEMSHPAAQCLFDRQNNVELGQPTVIGMSYSLDYPSRLGGFSWFQKPRCHNILKLSDKFKEALEKNAKMRKKLPQEIVVYRGGGSEGEFDEIRKEVDQMREACRYFGTYNPKITYVVVMANSNNMLVPANLPQRKIPAKEANVPSGTLIDGGVTNPTLCEFILVSQEGNIGTSRPMRCVVLVNEANIPKEEIYSVTYYLCFAHQASTQPTSKPNVLYAANELAKRGKNNWSVLMDRNGGGSMFSGLSGAKFDIKPGEEVDDYFERKSAEAKNPLWGTYWA